MNLRWNRRRLLLAGLMGGLVAGSSADRLRERRRAARMLADDSLTRYTTALEAAYASEAAWQEQVAELLSPSEPDLPPPPIPYDRETSLRMIRACKLAVTQYRTGRSVPSFDGDLTELTEFREFFPGYEHVTNFMATEENLERYLEVEPLPPAGALHSPLQDALFFLRRTLHETIPALVRREFRLPVYFGFLLKSDRDQLMVFRGTQTQAEWISNIRSGQLRYPASESEPQLGWVHNGFLTIATTQLRPDPAELAADAIDPELPLYLTGHSLGGALATITAMDLARRFPSLAERIRLYTYAAPRVGDATFAESFRQLVPNAYRVANVADTVPLVPSTKMGRGFAHVGEPWTFLAHFGDLLPNHIADTYLAAVSRQAEAPGRHRGLHALEGLPAVATGG
jgi:predicted lipase